MTSPFILDRAEVLAIADHADPWVDLDQNLRDEYIAMAEALTDHEREKGWKVVARPATDQAVVAGCALTGDDYRPSKIWTAMLDAAPPWPGGEK